MNKLLIKEVESSYDNISFTLYEKNLIGVVKEYTNSPTVVLEVENILSTYKVFEEMSTLLKPKGLSKVQELVNTYNKLYFCYEDFIIEDFYFLLQTGDYKQVVQFAAKGNSFRNVFYNFYTTKLLKFNRQSSHTVKDRVLEYAGAFYFFSLLLLLYKVLQEYISEENFTDFCYRVHEKISFGIVTGFIAYTELTLPYKYGCLAEELISLTSADEKRLSVKANPEKQTINFKIKGNYIFQETYEEYGYNDSMAVEDISKDRNLENYFRIKAGATPNSVRLVYEKANGQRTLGRIFGFNETAKIYVDKLHDSGLPCRTNMLIFCLISILRNCNFRDVKRSSYKALNSFIKGYNVKGKRYVAERIAVIALMAFRPELQQEIINDFFKHSQQRADILKDVKKLKRLLKKTNKSVLEEFMKAVRFYYAW